MKKNRPFDIVAEYTNFLNKNLGKVFERKRGEENHHAEIVDEKTNIDEKIG